MHKVNQQGTLLLEVLIVTFLFGVLGTGLIGTVITSSQASKQGTEYVAATGYIKEGIEAVRSIRDQDWSQISNGTHGLTTSSGYYELSGSSNTLDTVFTRTITVEDVYRTGSLTGDIAASGVLDSNTKKVTVNVTWDVLSGRTQNIDAEFYVANWDIQSWTQTLTADWTAGNQNSTNITTISNGEVQLAAHDADWDNTQVEYTIDLPGSGDWETAYVDQVNDVLFVLAGSTSGNDFVGYDISDVTNSTPTSLGGYDIQNANDFVISAGYAFIVTDDDSVEVDVINLSTYTQVTTIDLTGSANANTVDISGTTLVIGRDSSGDDELWFYDISTPSSPSFLRSTDVSASFNDLAAGSSYVFGTSDNNSEEVFAFQISDGSQVGTLDLSGNDDAKQLHLVGTNLYVARDDGSSFDLALVDVSTASSMSLTSSLELGETLNDVDIDEDEAYAIVATDNNSEEVIVVNLSSFTKETSVDTTGSDDAKSAEIGGGYIYVGSTANSNDLMIVGVASGGWDSPSQIASVDKSGNYDANEVYVSGNYTYLVTQNDGTYDEVWIYDTSTPSSPTYLGSFDVGADVNDLVVSGNYAYLATDDDSRELDIIDVTTKTSPSRIGSLDLSGGQNAHSIVLNGSTAYIGRASGSEDEFAVVHTLNPGGWSYPTLTSTSDKNGNQDGNEIYVSGNYAYLVSDSGSQELFVFDISNPTSPSVQDSFSVGARVNDVYVSGNYVYLATDDNNRELDIIDASVKTSLSRLTSYNLGGNQNAFSVSGSGDYVYVGRDASGNDELYVFDVSTPSTPVLDGSVNHGGDINKIVVSGNYVYAATDDNSTELAVFNVSTSTNPTYAGGLNLTGNANAESVAVFSSTVVIGRASSSNAELYVIDVSTPTTPILSGSGEIGDTVRDISMNSASEVVIVGDLNNEEFQYWDISTPSSPSQTGVYDIDAVAMGVHFNGTYAFIATEHNTQELTILEAGSAATTPVSPVLAGSYNFDSGINDLVYSNDYVFGATTDNSKELVVFDVSTVSSPSESASYDLTSNVDAESIAYSSSVLTIGRDNGGSSSELAVFDISTPTSPSLSGEGEVGDTVYGVWMDDSSIVYVASDENDNEFQRWDISTPSSPTEDSTFDLDADANGIYFNGTYAFLATEHNSQELQIIGQGTPPSQYTRAGSFTSQAFDSGSAVTWNTITWTESGTGDIEFRIRTSSTQAGLTSAVWVGSDGTNDTTYSTSSTSITTDSGASGTQWIQWKAYLTGDTTSSPALEDVSFTYSP